MLEQCDFMELTEEVLQQCKGFTCKDEDITEFFTQDYADYAYQLLGKSYCFVKPDTSEIVCAFTVANSSVKVDSLPSNLRNKLNRQYPAVLVGQLAVSDLFSGHHVGDELLDFIKSWFIDPLNKTGCRYVIVDAVNHPKVFEYYQRNGFKFLFSSDEEEWTFLHNKGLEQTTPIEPMKTRLMYFDLIYLRTK
ncbi:N-acetyltransferase [Segatella copri]|uniref:N-acetyltransferase n=2 Tax=Segatella copri TaxID=165179 RepID=A0AA91YXZ5_9BACT|nr:N-acetyltransferase [Segatella copri]